MMFMHFLFSRRTCPWLPGLILLSLTLSPSSWSGGRHQDAQVSLSDQPNILFIFADDWGYPHAGAYGDPVVETPTFDRVAAEGILFERAFVSAPSCTPSRSAILSGQDFWRLGPGANLWSRFPDDIDVYPSLLAEQADYFTGHTGKGWDPGRIGDRLHNPAGPDFESFEQFLAQRPDDQPFAFWFGSYDPHRPYSDSLRRKMEIDPDQVVVPPSLPDVPAVRRDIANYYAEVQRFDRKAGELLSTLAERGELANTIVVMSGDHGWPFPRGKANLYDMGTRVPLAIRWPGKTEARRTVTEFVNLTDLAPTFLEAAGVSVPEQMTGQSLVDLLRGSAADKEGRDYVVVGRERHTPAQEAPSDGGYPMRALRTEEYLYIRNYYPARWPAGTPNPDRAYKDDAWLSDVDNGAAKFYMWTHRRESSRIQQLFQLSFGKRPAEELYDLRTDPHQLHNVATDPDYADVRQRLAERLTKQLRKREDPRTTGKNLRLDRSPYFGGVNSWPGSETFKQYR
jgi:arylsulfatase A-like enzyme